MERGWLGRGGRGFGEDEEDGRVKPWARGGEAGRPELGYGWVGGSHVCGWIRTGASPSRLGFMGARSAKWVLIVLEPDFHYNQH